jgi:hypothetical protein
VPPVKYELGFYIPEGDILHSHRRENLKFYIFTNAPEENTISYFSVKIKRNTKQIAGCTVYVKYIDSMQKQTNKLRSL